MLVVFLKKTDFFTLSFSFKLKNMKTGSLGFRPVLQWVKFPFCIKKELLRELFIATKEKYISFELITNNAVF